MKKLISVFIATVLLLTTACSYAENSQPFDYHVLEGMEGYQYDKFEKTWCFSQELKFENDNNIASFLIMIVGNSARIIGATGAAVSVGNQIVDCDKVVMLSGDKTITVRTGKDSSNFMTPGDEEALLLIANADGLSVRFYAGEKKYDFEIKKDAMSSFKESVNALIESNCLDSLTTFTVNPQGPFTIE